MTTDRLFKNILIIGATGSIGSVVLTALLAEPSFTVTILRRASSTGSLPSPIKTIIVPDAYPKQDLITAFQNQDAIINCMTSLSVAAQRTFIDAAITAKVRRYIPSEYGLDNALPRAQALNSVFRDKGAVRAYLRSKEGEIEWMAVSCGMWLKWSMGHDFLGMHVKERRFVLWDEGEGVFSCSTEENTALGLVRALVVAPELTKNRNVSLSDFAVSQRELLRELERQTGEEAWKIEKVDSFALIAEKQKAVEEGDESATFALIETGFVTGRYGGHMEKEGEIMNEVLGLPKKTLEEVVAGALKAHYW